MKKKAYLEEVFFDHKIIEVVIITSDKQYRLDFIEEIIVKRDNNKSNSYSEADFKHLNKNDIEDLYYFCLNNKVNYHIDEINPYSIVDVPFVGIVYLNSKEEKRIIGLLTPQLYESAGSLPRLKLPLHSCSLAGSTSAMEVSIPIAFVLPGREHDCNESFNLRRPPALS
ncbi:hypothetical protein Tco_0218476 [Tanacetum coccineum]